MPGQQVFLYQKNNKLIDAAIAADIAASGKAPLIYPVTKKGTGNVKIQGNYDGALDAEYEIKINDTAFTEPVVSAPVFKGAGTGKIKDIAASGLEAQKITTLLLSTGVSTQNAEVEIEGLLFRAKAAGAEGNGVSISIDNSTLVFTLTEYSTLKDLKIGDTALEGQEWDFDTKVILGDIIPDTAHRVAFGSDNLHIYRQYKKFEDGAYKYYFILPIKYEVKKSSKIYFVTEGRTITVTDGVTTEEYTNIITIADFWQKIKDLPSALIEPVNSSINTSKTPSSPAVRELAVMTDAYTLPPYKAENSSEYAGELTSIVVKESTKTELIEIKCTDNAYIGEEIWDVKGSSSGELGQAKTGDFNDFGPVGFTIPQKFPKDWGSVKEDWSYKIDYASRGAGVEPPPICFAMRLGINSIAQTLTLTYKKRPTDCVCPTVSFSDRYLGFDEKGGEIGMAYTIEDLVFWVDAMAEIMKEQFTIFEYQEGREGTPPPVEDPKIFSTPTREYFNNFKTLARRMMALPEDKPEDLAAMLTDFQTLVQSLTLQVIYAGLPNNPYELTWVAGEWTGGPETYGSITNIQEISYDTDTYLALVEAILLYEKTYGLKKNNVFISDDGSYQTSDSEYFWEVNGSKAYLPAFTDVPYYSNVKSGCGCEGEEFYVNTKEFAFSISVPCGGTLLEGDVITVTIGGRTYERTYQLGDITYLPTIAASDLNLVGGIDGDDTYVFEVKGDIDSLPDYLLDRDNPQPYKGTKAPAWQAGHPYSLTNYVKAVTFNGCRYECTTAGTSGGTQPTWPTTPGQTVNDNGVVWTCRIVELSLEIEDGIVMFQVGDSFEFNIEGGHFKWRKDGGAWSAAISISEDFQELDDGLEIAFDFGVSPSFVVDDLWEILAIQENKAANMVTPWNQKTKGADNIVFSFAAPVAIDSLIIDKHNFTGTITFQASDDEDFDPLIYEEEITVTDLICKLYEGEDVITAQYFRIIYTGAYEIGHCFLGTMMRLASDADSVLPLKRFNMSRQEGKTPFSLYNYARKGFTVNYNTFIRQTDYDLLNEMIDFLKTNNDMPLYFVPNINYPGDCIRGLIDADNIEQGSDIDYNAPPDSRLFTLSLPVVGTL